MFMTKKLMACLALLAFSGSAYAGVYAGLTPDQKKLVDSGKQVFVTVDAGEAWPKAYVYQAIEATPEEAMAVFADVEIQKDYVPGLLKSKLVKWVDKRTFQADYTLNVPPPLDDENYTVEDKISTHDGGKSYRMDWRLVKASSVKATNGYMVFEPHGNGTIMAYYNYVVPGSSLAGIGAVKKRAMKQVQETATATSNQIKKERISNQPLLQKQLKALRAILSR